MPVSSVNDSCSSLSNSPPSQSESTSLSILSNISNSSS